MWNFTLQDAVCLFMQLQIKLLLALYLQYDCNVDLVVKLNVVGQLDVLFQTADGVFQSVFYFTVIYYYILYDLLQQEETDCPHQCFLNHVGHNQSCDLLNTAMIEVMIKFFWSSTSSAHRCREFIQLILYLKETEAITECFKTPKVTGWLPIIKVKLLKPKK